MVCDWHPKVSHLHREALGQGLVLGHIERAHAAFAQGLYHPVGVFEQRADHAAIMRDTDCGRNVRGRLENGDLLQVEAAGVPVAGGVAVAVHRDAEGLVRRDEVIACVGGGSNSIGICFMLDSLQFYFFLLLLSKILKTSLLKNSSLMYVTNNTKTPSFPLKQ